MSPNPNLLHVDKLQEATCAESGKPRNDHMVAFSQPWSSFGVVC